MIDYAKKGLGSPFNKQACRRYSETDDMNLDS